jgi:cellulose synthase/poly-beta-1,6-N-acetylglucosamine synthase-like glycosyltransferase
MNAYSEKMKPKLSILTPTIRGREPQLSALQDKVAAQNSGEVEHLALCDNRARTIGAKRQALVDIARGEYIAFVDDDDDISEDYIPELLKAIETGADVITFHQRSVYNGLESEVHFGINNNDESFNPGGITLRAPWHVCAWRRDAVDGCLFGESNYGEDRIWCLQARQRVKKGYHIPKVIHTYRHDAATTAAPET